MNPLNGRIPTIALLVTLFVTQPILSGCTVLNYAMGYGYDQMQATPVPITDWNDLTPSQDVQVELLTCEVYRGRVKRVIDENSFRMSYSLPNQNSYEQPAGPFQMHERTFERSEIVHLYSFTYSHKGRTWGLVLGLTTDLLIALAVTYITLAGRAAAATGG